MTEMTHPIPDAVLDKHVGILGKTGTGKTYTAIGLVERLLTLGRHVAVIDPTGAYYGLRSEFEIPIFGGRHGDVAIDEDSGPAVAELVISKPTSAIVDLSMLHKESGASMRRFLGAFVRTIKGKEPGPFWLIVDEADEFLPQNIAAAGRSGTASTRLFGDLKWIVRRGRIDGFRVVMVTQRPAEISKSVLTQIETLIAHRLTAPQDRKAVEEWIKGHSDAGKSREVLSSLASLETGEAWIWAPDMNLLEKSRIPLNSSYDSGATPDADTAAPVFAPVGDVDLDSIRKAIGQKKDDTPSPESAKARAADDQSLQAANNEIARLEAGLSAARADRDKLAKDLALARDEASRLWTIIGKVRDELTAQMVNGWDSPSPPDSVAGVAETAPKPAKTADYPPVERVTLPERSPMEAMGFIRSEIPSGCRKVLAALASVHPAGMTRAQLGVQCKIKSTGSTMKAYVSRLKTAGMIETVGNELAATMKGLTAIGPVKDLPPKGPALARAWASKLSGTGPIVEKLIEAWPRWRERAKLGEQLDIKHDGSTMKAYISRLNSAGVIEKRGVEIRLSPDVME